MDVHVATCECGALRVEARGEPRRVSVCHCLACQRRTGSAFGVQAPWPTDRVTISGEHRTWIRQADEDGEARVQHFCPECGSTVFYTYGDAVDTVVIPIGAFADPGFAAPTRFIYAARRHPWVQLEGEDRCES